MPHDVDSPGVRRPLQELADFGNSYYNDHHYHWGYFIQTGALIAYLDPSYVPKMKNWVEGLIRDANNPSPQDKSFPQFRYFDWYSGHSWSQVGLLNVTENDHSHIYSSIP